MRTETSCCSLVFMSPFGYHVIMFWESESALPRSVYVSRVKSFTVAAGYDARDHLCISDAWVDATCIIPASNEERSLTKTLDPGSNHPIA